MKYQVDLPNNLYKSIIEVEVAGSQLQATETVTKDGRRISSNGVEVDFVSPAEAQDAAATAANQRLSLKAISQLD